MNDLKPPVLWYGSLLTLSVAALYAAQVWAALCLRAPRPPRPSPDA